ncbi:MAG: hypothetical protein WKG07_34290 [Hymenobacter sp.]
MAKKGIQVENKPTTKLTARAGELVGEGICRRRRTTGRKSQKIIQAKRQSELRRAAPKPPRPARTGTAPRRPRRSLRPRQCPRRPRLRWLPQAAPVAPAAASGSAGCPRLEAAAAPGLPVLGRIELDSQGRVVQLPSPLAARRRCASCCPADGTGSRRQWPTGLTAGELLAACPGPGCPAASSLLPAASSRLPQLPARRLPAPAAAAPGSRQPLRRPALLLRRLTPRQPLPRLQPRRLPLQRPQPRPRRQPKSQPVPSRPRPTS